MNVIIGVYDSGMHVRNTYSEVRIHFFVLMDKEGDMGPTVGFPLKPKTFNTFFVVVAQFTYQRPSHIKLVVT